ncbi:MAG: electron transporter RnfG [Dethiosulfovibrio peptidovorans]|nr:MAG: electron transporter RnfG [Dethiosulfovibrio peptidovorans]
MAFSRVYVKSAAKVLRLGLILCMVTAITGMLLGVVERLTSDAIRMTQEKEKSEALSAVMPKASSFVPVDIELESDSVITEVHEAFHGGESIGLCVVVVPRGYAGPIELLVGLTPKGGVQAIRIMRQSETPGLGAKAARPSFWKQFDEKEMFPLQVVKNSPALPEEIQAISGATITSSAVVSGVNAAVAFWEKSYGEGQK